MTARGVRPFLEAPSGARSHFLGCPCLDEPGPAVRLSHYDIVGSMGRDDAAAIHGGTFIACGGVQGATDGAPAFLSSHERTNLLSSGLPRSYCAVTHSINWPRWVVLVSRRAFLCCVLGMLWCLKRLSPASRARPPQAKRPLYRLRPTTDCDGGRFQECPQASCAER